MQIGNRKVVGVGVALPGLVDTDRGEGVFSAQLKWQNVEFRDIIMEEVGDISVTIGLSANIYCRLGANRGGPKIP